VIVPGVDVWIARANGDGFARPATPPALSPEERARAAKFIRTEDREAYVFRRAFVRAVLARYVSVPPDSIELATGPSGKPALTGALSRRLEFNVSHSDGITVCAVCDRRVGIDVEAVRGDQRWRPAARRVFTPVELQEVERRGARAFFTVWTLKEATIKAHGGTLADIGAFDVASVLTDGPAVRRGVELHVVDVGSGYAAAVATAQRDAAIRVREWSPSREWSESRG
jgi:4'-phosphopantetheinyl transferase